MPSYCEVSPRCNHWVPTQFPIRRGVCAFRCRACNLRALLSARFYVQAWHPEDWDPAVPVCAWPDANLSPQKCKERFGLNWTNTRSSLLDVVISN